VLEAVSEIIAEERRQRAVLETEIAELRRDVRALKGASNSCSATACQDRVRATEIEASSLKG
jgi:HPt (histidine-containing phosphotransfer) domain-containing protein